MCTKCIETERKCKCCGLVKPIEEFYWVDNNKLYRRRVCIQCRKDADNERYKNDAEYREKKKAQSRNNRQSYSSSYSYVYTEKEKQRTERRFFERASLEERSNRPCRGCPDIIDSLNLKYDYCSRCRERRKQEKIAEKIRKEAIREAVMERYPYMRKSKEERQAHLDLSEPCIQKSGGMEFLSTNCRGMLAYKLNTPIFNGTMHIHLAHACHNSCCSNWKHLYWAWVYENYVDRIVYEKNPHPFIISDREFIGIEYMKLTQKERQSHLRLDEPCMNVELFIKKRGMVSAYCKGLLADVLGTEIFYKDGIHLCHACHNGDCMNPYHHYWGTASENRRDRLTWENILESA